MNPDIKRLRDAISQVIIGKGHVIDLLVTALLANGHCLIDDVPGMGKTKLANALARSMGVRFKRIQFTPDLQPADITGIYYYNQKEGEFLFRGGPVFTNILLADEINRAVPRTQASLLEAMEEYQVSVDGTISMLEPPFMVIATQNPIELEGTFPLPEAQLDRFLLRVHMGYPSLDDEVSIMKRFKMKDPLEDVKPVLGKADILKLRQEVKDVKVSDALLSYIGRLAAASRTNPQVQLGLSPRASLSLMRASMAFAFIHGRDYVLPDDLQYLFPFVASHRIILNYESDADEQSKSRVMEEILTRVPVPVEEIGHG